MRELLLAVLMFSAGAAYAVPKDTHFFFDPARLSPGILPSGVIIPILNVSPALSGVFIKKGGDQTDGELRFTSGTVYIPIGTPDYEEGKVYYHDVHFGLEVMTDVEGIVHHLGQGLMVRFRNKTGSTLTSGSAIYQDGVQGNVPTMALAKADAFPQAQAFGIITMDTLNNSLGWITSLGHTHDLDTTAFTEGDTLYLSQSTPGLLVSAKPASGLIIVIGTVLREHGSQGEINVHIANETDLTGGAGTCGTGIDCQGAQTSTTICATTCATHPVTLCQVTSSTDFDIYNSTGPGLCQFRNSRTGLGPLQ